MAARATTALKPSSETVKLVRLSAGRVMRLIWRPRKRLSLLLATLLASWVPHWAHALDPNTLPTQGTVKVGSGQITQSGSKMVVTQNTQRLGLDWQTFSIGANGQVTFVQPGKDAVALNRVVGNDASQIFGRLTANGQVFLVNANGVLFAPGSKVDVGGIIASSLNLSQDDFEKGKYQFVAVDAAGKVLNQGDIKAGATGYVALFGPQVKNEGVINVPAGQVVLAAGRAVTVDITGSGLINAVVTQGAANSAAENSGIISAEGGTVRMTAKAAQDTVGGLVNNTGVIKANSLVSKNGEIWLMGDTVTNTGEVRAEGGTTLAGGAIHVEAPAVALGGILSADGSQGGQVFVTAGQRLSLADTVTARGLISQGGHIVYSSGGGIIETGTGHTDASGATDGGTIQVAAASGISSSGHYNASGATGMGGRIDVSGSAVYLLSAELDASGALGGGRIRVGGDFQGGKGPAPTNADEVNRLFVRRWEDSVAIANANSVFINDGTSLNVSSRDGQGGTAIVWSDSQTTFIGAIDARGAAGGGSVEISSGDALRKAALDRVQIGNGGQLLLDPKNILIGDSSTLQQWQYSGVLESVYAWKATVSVLGNYDYMGVGVALSSDAHLMAVGAGWDDGADGTHTDSGAVHLFSFQDSSFGGGALVGTVGVGYLGGKNINIALDNSDLFGYSVALSATGQQMAVGAVYDDGATNAKYNAGAVHLFTFTDTAFSGGVKVGTIGDGYTGTGNVAVTLRSSDQFGQGVALSGDGTRLIVGSPYDDGANGVHYDAGAVYLYSFGAGFTNGTLSGRIGADYSGAGNLALAQGNYAHFGTSVAISRDGNALAVGAYNETSPNAGVNNTGAVRLFTLNGAYQPAQVASVGMGYSGANDINLTLDVNDYFGMGVALNGDGTRLAVGASGDDGFFNDNGDSGAVHLFTFAQPGFQSGQYAGTLGWGYTGGKSVHTVLNGGDGFGYSVAMSADARSMAVGAPYDDGAKRNLYDGGAVHLFTFSDSNFSGGKKVGTVGYGYVNDRGDGIPLDGSRTSNGADAAGSAVSLSADARLLAVGAPGDDGLGDSSSNTGAVHLITFSDGNFSGATLAGTIGYGYTGGSNVAVSLRPGDEFGSGVALSGDGQHLAVGAHYDDGVANNYTNAGAVHLFTFADTAFGGGQKVGTLGRGYTGSSSMDLALGANNYFGQSVALNYDGTRLAVGEPTYYNYGVVHLFTFGTGFSSPSLAASVGYSGLFLAANNNVAVSLNYWNRFGNGVSLNSDGTRLAVGDPWGSDASGTVNYVGNVRLFTFGNAFASGAQVGTIGLGFTNVSDVNLTIASNDNFGTSVSLNADATALAVGTPGDYGWGRGSNTGAVHLFTFGNAGFGGGALTGIIGNGYSGGDNVSISLDYNDRFGNGVALNGAGNRLAVGAPNDSGANNAASGAGAVHLFTFSDNAFHGGQLAGHLGNGYVAEKAVSLDVFGSKSWNGDNAGNAVGLSADATQLAIGAPNDDGATVSSAWSSPNYGAVYLVKFTDGNFSGGTVAGIMGKGYTGGKNVDVALDSADAFGYSLSLSGDGKHLAVGATGDDGLNNSGNSSGAVHLFTFNDTSFAGGQLKGSIGYGYGFTGANDIAKTTTGIGFGYSVALNADGTVLAVGSPYEWGLNSVTYQSGAVRLYTVASDYSSASYIGSMGKNFSGGNNVNVSLRSYDYFGASVALNASGTQLAVGATGDDGYSGNDTNTGAVRLYTFGAGLTSGALASTVGMGYTGAQDINLSLTSSGFASAVALSTTGQQLAVGAPNDYGRDGSRSNAGAVHLFTFTDTSFGGGARQAIIGSGYTGGKNLESGAGNTDYFGRAVALNGAGTRLAVGAPGDDGNNNTRTDAGAVYLFGFSDAAFSNGQSMARVGVGYQAQSAYSLPVSGYGPNWNGDRAGAAVGLSADATQMVIGAPYTDAGNGVPGAAGGDYGAVHLVTFTDGNFNGASLVGTIGVGFTGGKNISVSLDSSDLFGASVALSGDGKHLAVGAANDSGYSNAGYYALGAVHLFTFGNTVFDAGQKIGTVGYGYAGSGDYNMSNLGYYQRGFGSGIALNYDGTRMAVGARYDYGFNNVATYSGAVHLFTFANTAFGGATKVGTMGKGYVGTGDVNVALDSYDYFGVSVALSADATRLAVGASGDAGSTNSASAAGAVHFFTFTNTSFAGAVKVGTIGLGYTGTGNVNVSALQSNDQFGAAIALSADATKLVVGAPYDSGLNNGYYQSGAVYTVTFGDTSFGTGNNVGTIGWGYTGANNYTMTSSGSSNYLNFGSSVALSADGTRMAVGMPGDTGTSALYGANAGAVQLFTLGAGLTTPSLVGTVGRGYSGSQSLDAPFLGAGSNGNGDRLGQSVSLSGDGTLLAIGAPGDSGGDNRRLLSSAGAVYLMQFGDGDFGSGSLQGVVGSGYTGGKNINVRLDSGDEFGTGVALSRDGTHLAVGAPYDDGYNNTVANSGAVHLFTFTDAAFSGGQKIGTLGNGYVGTNDMSGPVSANAYFGYSVALNNDGTRLAVGAPTPGSFGSVHLFTFGGGFTGGALAASIGNTAATSTVPNANNITLSLSQLYYYSRLGTSVALSGDGTLLAAGATGSYGSANGTVNSGAVYLFGFGNAFTGGQLAGTMGIGYSGTNDINVTLGSYEYFGSSVALSADGTRLAVGATGSSGSALSNTGSVRLFTFGNTFTSGTKVGAIGMGATGVNDLSVTLDSSDYFGSGVALNSNATRMVVGASGDDGNNNSASQAGAVHLFGFSDGSFHGAQRMGILGQGYTSSAQVLNLPLVGSNSSNYDQFGTSVALSGDGLLMAVGTPGDAGGAKDTLGTNQGAVRLFSFSGSGFAGGQLLGTIGNGYTGGKNVSISLDNGDGFGSSVALSRDGKSLAVGAPGDDGLGNNLTDSGAVHLFTFTDTAFSSGQKAATLGSGYYGGNNLNVALDQYDAFGYSVALSSDGTRLAVGTPYDAGFNNARARSGAVHLFTFGSQFTNGAKVGTVGYGYTGTGDVNVTTLDSYDYFGTSVALSGAADLMAVGATGDYGATNNVYNAGAVHLFSFGTAFSGGTKVGTLGVGYTGTNDLNLPLASSDGFGRSVALNLDGTRLAVGAPGDDGAADTHGDAGAIYLLNFGSGFTGGAKVATVGADYSGSGDVNYLSSGALGTSVALSADASMLAAGLIYDNGFNNDQGYAGAVKLFTFSDTSFGGGRIAGTMGRGYAAAAQSKSMPWDPSVSYTGDYFGSSVAMDSTGTLLAVGAQGDDGFANTNRGSGAVYLFQFDAATKTQATLVGTVGSGYTGGKNVSVALDAGDAFGAAVALSADGTRMAVGANGDDGYLNQKIESGAVHLFSFTDSVFSGGAKTGTLGYGYTGTGSLNVPALDYYDRFGSSVALSANGNLLAVGAPLDKGATNSLVNTYYGFGAVHLFSYGAGAWSKTGTIGQGYTGAGNFNNTALGGSDDFGSAVALSADGTMLAVGASTYNSYGTVQLFTMGSGFASPAKVGTLGTGYNPNLTDSDTTNDRNLNVNTLRSGDLFGSAVALTADGRHLAVGASSDDGFAGTSYNSGAVHLFSFADSSFSTPTRLTSIGIGYSAVADVSNRLESNDRFGSAVAMNADGSRIAVGAWNDAGTTVQAKSASGAVHVFAFTDTTNYSQGFEVNTLGDGRRPSNVSFPSVTTNDQFGAAVALSADGTRLAVGAPGDDGVANDRIDSGAVHLFSFTDGNFSGATLQGTVGYGYSGGKNVNVNLGWGDAFGSAIALSADAKLMAVGAPGDDGVNHDRLDAGAVHLFTFTDSNFSGGAKVGTVGYGYTGGKNVNVTNLDPGDNFGASVALSADGTRLAVGAPYDDGFNNNYYYSPTSYYGPYSTNDYGAVYGITFADSAFSGGTQIGIAGMGYGGTNGYNVALDTGDYFGRSVALNANATLLAVGAPGDDGYGNVQGYAGAVHLFSFADTSFTTPSKVGTIGMGYTGAGNTPIALDYNDALGTSVALSADGKVLAVGAPNDSGAGNTMYQSGAVHLFNFADTAFGGGTQVGSLGYGYNNIGQVSVTLAPNDHLGTSVALNAAGDRLAAGMPGRDTTGGKTLTDTGGVYLFASSVLPTSSNLAAQAFTDNSTGTSAIAVSDLVATLAAGTSVTLQANNDLKLATALNVTGTSGGNLTLTAGRSIALNGDVTTANGSLTLNANALATDGVVAAQRDAGAASISMGTGNTIHAGTGNVSMRVSAGVPGAASGNITLGAISANSITVENLGATSGGNLTLNGALSSSADIVLATNTGNFYNNVGASALTSSAGRWLVYTGDWITSVENGLVGAAGSAMPRLYNQTYAGSPPSGVVSGNHILYRSQPTVTLYVYNQNKVYGAVDPNLTYYSYGLLTDDGVTDTYQTAGISTPTLSVSPTLADTTTRAAGNYTINVAYSQLGTNAGYLVNTGSAGTLTVSAKQLSLSGLSISSKVYDGTNTASIYALGTVSGLLAGDTVQVNSGSASAAFTDAHAGFGKTVNITGITLSGASAGNYSVANLSTTSDILPKTVTLSSFTANNKVYDGGTSATIASYGSLSGLVGSETLVVGAGTARFANKNVGTGKTVTLTSAFLSNGTGWASDYVLSTSFPSTTASITAKSITASGTRVYDGTTVADASALGLLGTVGGDVVTLLGAGTLATKDVGTNKAVSVGTLALQGTDAGNYQLGGGSTLTITQRQLAVTGMTVQNRVYDGTTTANFTGTPTVSGSLLPGDNVSLQLGNISVAFVDKNAGYNKPLVATGLGLTGADAQDYAIVVRDTATIAPRSLNVGITAQNKVYDATRTASVTYTDDRIQNDTLSISGAALFDTKNVGTGKTVTASFSLTGADAQNYVANNSATATANITARSLTVNASAVSKVYDGTNVATINFSDNHLAGDAVAVNASASFADKNAANGKTVTGNFAVTGSDASNYSLVGSTAINLTANITPRALQATGTRVYDGTLNIIASDLGLANTINGDSVALAGIGAMVDKNVGTHKAVSGGTLALSGTDASNYSLSSAYIDITPRMLTVSGISAQDKVYDGTRTAVATGTPVLTGSVIANDQVSVVPTPSITVEFADKNAGQNKTLLVAGGLITGTDAGNYQVVVDATANITKRDLTIGATAQNKVYDGTRNAAIQVTDNRITNDALTISATGTFADKNVGTGKAVSVNMAVSGADAINYNYTPVTSSSANITVRALNLTSTAQNKVYDGTTTAALTLGADSRVQGDTLTVTAQGTFADKNIGSAKGVSVTYSVSGTDAGNYSYATSGSSQADITVKMLTFSNLIVSDKVYDGTTAANIAGNFSLASGLIIGDNVSADVSSATATFANKNAGANKTVSVTGVTLTGTDSGNYAVASSAGTATIFKKALDVTGLTPASKVYDGTVNASAEGVPNISAGFISGDTVALNVGNFTVAFADKNVGINKPLHVTGSLLTGADAINYDPVLNTFASITPRALNPQAVVQNKVYDGTTAATLSFTDSRVNGDVLSISGSAAFADKNAGANKQVNVSGIQISGTDAGNYSFSTSSQTATATIAPRMITASGTRVYDGTTSLGSSTYSFTNLVNGDDVALASTVALANKNVGSNKSFASTLLLDGLDAGNYVLTNMQYAVTPKVLTYGSLSLSDKVYDGNVNANISGNFTLTGGFVNGDNVSADLSTANAVFADKNAGLNKAVTVSGVTLSGTDAGNYSVVSSLGTASIFKKTLDVSGLTPSSKVYDGTVSASTTGTPNVTAAFINGDNVALNVGNFTVEFADKNVGANKPLHVTGNLLTGTDAVNYDPVLNGTANITARALNPQAVVQNKVYDGTTAATLSFSDNKVVGDAVTITGSAAFADKNAGVGKTVNVTGIQIAGVDASNYSYSTSNQTTTANITSKSISATGSREYDGTTAIPNSSLALSGLVGSDAVTLGSAVSLTDKNVGTNKAVSGGLTLGGTDAGNYMLSGLQYSVTPKQILVSGVTAASREYDGTTNASVTGTAALVPGQSFINGDQVSFSLSNYGVAFVDKNAGLNKPLQLTGNVLSGTDAGNYMAVLNSTATITPRQLSVTGVGVNNKVYDGTTTAVRSGNGVATLTGTIVQGDDYAVDLTNLSVAFADKNAGVGKSLVISGTSVSGADAGNYQLVVPNATANITPASLTVAANNVVRRAGEADPNPFTGSIVGGQLYGADSLTLNTIVPLPDTSVAKGGELYALTLVASHPNYNITVRDGYMLVLSTPAPLYVDALGQNNTSIAAVVTPQQLREGAAELRRVQTETVAGNAQMAAPDARQGVTTELSTSADMEPMSAEELREAVELLQDVRNRSSDDALKRLRNLPRVPRRPASLPQLLSDSSSAATVK